MFDKFGPVEECTVLRDDNGLSLGGAAVRFTDIYIHGSFTSR